MLHIVCKMQVDLVTSTFKLNIFFLFFSFFFQGEGWGGGVNEKSDIRTWTGFLQLKSADSKVGGRGVKILKNVLT